MKNYKSFGDAYVQRLSGGFTINIYLFILHVHTSKPSGKKIANEICIQQSIVCIHDKYNHDEDE